MKPLVYIASLRRTGSTLLSEALTQPPHAFVFVEPSLAANVFGLKKGDDEVLRREGFDLRRRIWWMNQAARARRYLGVDPRYTIRRFRREILPMLALRIHQVGVKEIRHGGWRLYHENFPDMKIILTARDPRDIYISLHHRVARGQGSWRGPLSPDRVAEDLLGEFSHQIEMDQCMDCLKVRYEDLCTRPATFDDVKAFTRSDIPSMGQVGRYLSGNPGRVGEHEVHQGQVTDRRVARWTREEDPELRQAAQKTFDLMPEYCDFWGYQREMR